jgi:hypothetical protein
MITKARQRTRHHMHDVGVSYTDTDVWYPGGTPYATLPLPSFPFFETKGKLLLKLIYYY